MWITPHEELKTLTDKTVATRTELKQELKQIRSTGVSFDIDGNTEGLSGAASVIRDVSGKTVAATCTGVPTYSFNEERK